MRHMLLQLAWICLYLLLGHEKGTREKVCCSGARARIGTEWYMVTWLCHGLNLVLQIFRVKPMPPSSLKALKRFKSWYESAAPHVDG